MPKAKKATKKSKLSVSAPSNLSVFVIVLLVVALGTVTWLFISMSSSLN